jgi:5-deoxy-5-amino-3-dehydroquinate synthase
VLVGLSGTGKSTLAPVLARRLSMAHADLDRMVEAREAMSVAEVFRRRGEAAFRALEVEALRDAVAGPPAVIAAGGGLVTTPAAREVLASATRVVWLRADPRVLSARLAAGGEERPLLAGDAESALRQLAGQREDLYREVADLVVGVDADGVEGIVEHIAEWAGSSGSSGQARPRPGPTGGLVVSVPLGERGYDVHVGAGVNDLLADVLPPGVRRVAVVTQEGIGVDVDPGVEHRVWAVGDGEVHKSVATVEHLCSQWARWGLTRADCVVGVGGGLVTDVAGFAASVYHRGLPVVHVSTTLLGQIDAAIGGKTGVNLPEGKNLVGTYWQPRAVLCDTDTLSTLPPREWRCGLGELAKYHWLGGGRLDELPLDERVAACVAIKADVVASDERESGRRALLNYGHTLAHAIEVAGRHDLRHGEAVAVGLVYAAELARRLGRIGDDEVAEHRRVVAGYDLPLRLPEGLDEDELMDLMGRDKKVLGGGLTFVLDGPEGVEVVPGVDPEEARAALGSLR